VNPLTLLKRQHKEVKELFGQLEDAEGEDSRRELLDQITEKLQLHMQIEEEIFYPAVRGIESKTAQETTGEAYEEHHVVKLVLADLPKIDLEDERFEAKMTVLSELIEHHVKEEEKEMFKRAKKLGKQELESLGKQMSERAGLESRGQGEDEEAA
jgi:iron-sulfur cluster repair protein YtfE (RIC family)